MLTGTPPPSAPPPECRPGWKGCLEQQQNRVLKRVENMQELVCAITDAFQLNRSHGDVNRR